MPLQVIFTWSKEIENCRSESMLQIANRRNLVRAERKIAAMVFVFHFRLAPVLQGVAFPCRSLLQDR